MNDDSLFQIENFRPQVGATFHARLANGQNLDLQLAEVQSGLETPQMLQFSLSFLGPLEPVLKQQILALSHPALGEFSLFVVPIARQVEGMVYQAIVGRLHEQ